MKKFLIGIVFLSLCGASYTKTKHTPVKEIVTEIAKHNIYESNFVGFAGIGSTQSLRLNQLVKIATNTELLSLTNHENGVVRLYVLRAIIARKIFISNEIRQKFYNDKSIVSTLQGCIGDKISVGEISKQILL